MVMQPGLGHPYLHNVMSVFILPSIMSRALDKEGTVSDKLIFFIVFQENICCGYSLELAH